MTDKSARERVAEAVSRYEMPDWVRPEVVADTLSTRRDIRRQALLDDLVRMPLMAEPEALDLAFGLPSGTWRACVVSCTVPLSMTAAAKIADGIGVGFGDVCDLIGSDDSSEVSAPRYEPSDVAYLYSGIRSESLRTAAYYAVLGYAEVDERTAADAVEVLDIYGLMTDEQRAVYRDLGRTIVTPARVK